MAMVGDHNRSEIRESLRDSVGGETHVGRSQGSELLDLDLLVVQLYRYVGLDQNVSNEYTLLLYTPCSKVLPQESLLYTTGS